MFSRLSLVRCCFSLRLWLSLVLLATGLAGCQPQVAVPDVTGPSVSSDGPAGNTAPVRAEPPEQPAAFGGGSVASAPDLSPTGAPGTVPGTEAQRDAGGPGGAGGQPGGAAGAGHPDKPDKPGQPDKAGQPDKPDPMDEVQEEPIVLIPPATCVSEYLPPPGLPATDSPDSGPQPVPPATNSPDSPDSAPPPASESAASTPPASPAPVSPPPLPPLPPPPAPGWQPLVDAVAATAETFLGRLSVVVVDLESGERWEYRGEECYHPASVIKIPVALYAAHQVEAGELSWEDPVLYTEADFEPPAGPFSEIPFGTEVPVASLVEWSLKYSNNTAVNMLGRHLGWRRIRAFGRQIGGPYSPGPWVNPQSAANWWLHLWQMSQENPMSMEPVLAGLREATHRGRVVAGVPAGVLVLHKYGSYAGYEHDAGIVYGPRPFLVLVFTADGGAGPANAAIARITRAAWEVFQQPQS